MQAVPIGTLSESTKVQNEGQARELAKSKPFRILSKK
jgi:hypothetical protein